MKKQNPIIRVEHLSIGYEGKVIMRDLSFEIPKGDIFIIMDVEKVHYCVPLPASFLRKLAKFGYMTLIL